MNPELLISLAIRSLVPPLIGAAAVFLCRRASASTRRLVWLLSFATLFVLPIALLKLPTVQVVEHVRSNPEIVSGNPLKPVEGLPGSVANKAGVSLPSQKAQVSEVLTQSRPRPHLVEYTGPSLVALSIDVWLFGVAILLLQSVIGLIRLSRLDLRPVTREDLLSELRSACTTLQLKRRPTLDFSSDVSVPMVFGHFRPRLVLSTDAMYWNAETIRAIFLHECAHVRRMDWIVFAFSRLVVCLYWFNPFVWLAASQFRAECEAAADDVVLLNGISPNSYASELLRIATEAGAPSLAGSLTILEVGRLKPRIARVLERNRARGSASPSAMGLSLCLSFIFAIALGVTTHGVVGQVISHNGFADIGNGRHVRIIAIVQRTATGTKAWNMRGELLPNSVPLPENMDGWLGSRRSDNPSSNIRYIVFAHNFDGYGIDMVEDIHHKWSGTPTPFDTITSNVSGMGYYVSRIDGDPISVADILIGDDPTGTIQCAVPAKHPSKVDSPPERTTILFDKIPLNPTANVAQTTDLDVPAMVTLTSNSPGGLLGITDLTHPEWGFWRPDGSPMPPIKGVSVPRTDGANWPLGQTNRRIGFLFRAGVGYSDRVSVSDVSGILLANEISILHTPSGRYDLNIVFVDPHVNSMRVIAKVPSTDTVIDRLKLKLTPTAGLSQNAVQFLFNRIGMQSAYYTFTTKLAPPVNPMSRNLQFLYKDKVAPEGGLSGYATDWQDHTLAISTTNPTKIVGANVLEHGYVYLNFSNVALYPWGIRVR